MPAPTSGTGLASLEQALAACQGEVHKALAMAGAIDRKVDDYAQDVAYERALKFLRMSAKVGLALAKLKGEHTSNVQIRRIDTKEQQLHVEFPAPQPKLPAPPSKPVDPETQDRINQIYDDWVRARAAARGDIENDHDDEEEEEGERAPPQNFSGSNGEK